MIAATLIGVETTLYAVAVALYTILLERGRLAAWDRTLVELLGRPAIEDVVSKVVSKGFGRAYVIIVSVNYLIGLVGAFRSMLTEDLTDAFIGAAFFGPAYASFLVAIELWMPWTVKRTVAEILKEKKAG